jgi:hypothetical protein
MNANLTFKIRVTDLVKAAPALNCGKRKAQWGMEVKLHAVY